MVDYEINKRIKFLIEDIYKTTALQFSKKYVDTRGIKTANIMRQRNGVSKDMLDAICTA